MEASVWRELYAIIDQQFYAAKQALTDMEGARLQESTA